MSDEQRDANVDAVRRKLESRAAIGLAKYGVTTERTDIGTLGWLRHAQEEAMDLCIYLERLIRDEEEKRLDRLKTFMQTPSVFEQACSCGSGPIGATQCPIHMPPR